jgi:hypothetical protein
MSMLSKEDLLRSVSTALDQIKNLEILVLSWEERLRVCEHRISHPCSPRAEGSALSTTSSMADDLFSISPSRRVVYPPSAEGKCAVKSCYDHALPEKRFCRKHVTRACHYPGCNKTRLGPEYCIRHGGGKRCEFPGCTKGASGTVGGGARWCIAHGGGRKCKIEGCHSTAKRAGLCSTHGGRYYCSISGCNKTAHGPRRLCTTHVNEMRSTTSPNF